MVPGRRWCHLVSDESLDELHRVRRRQRHPAARFQGDHYDVPEDYDRCLIAGGAEVVPSRELLRRLRGAGLRLTPAQRRIVHQRGGSPRRSRGHVTSPPITNHSSSSTPACSAMSLISSHRSTSAATVGLVADGSGRTLATMMRPRAHRGRRFA